MAPAILTDTQYSKLVKDIRTLLEEGRARARRAMSNELVQTYWEIGKRIAKEEMSDQAGYQITLLKDLADELKIDYSTLSRAVVFYRVYEIAPRSKSLSWSHYKQLLPITRTEEREYYEKLVEKEKLNREQLAHAIRSGRFEKESNNDESMYLRRELTRPTDPTYLYKAYVERVIDGDTILLRIDLGFQVLKDQRVRLALIDVPSIDEPLGKDAYNYVVGTLIRQNFIMVKTHKIDIYGRYVGHIFYSSRNLTKAEIFLEGKYLNQELVDLGYARVL